MRGRLTEWGIIMLVPLDIKNKRYWIEFSIPYELYVDDQDITALRKLVLKRINVKNIYEDWEIAESVKKTVAGLFEQGLSVKQVVNEIAQLYGIPEEHVFEVVDELLVLNQ